MDRKRTTTQVFLDLKISPESVELVFQLPVLLQLQVPQLQALKVQGASAVSQVVEVSQAN